MMKDDDHNNGDGDAIDSSSNHVGGLTFGLLALALNLFNPQPYPLPMS